ncbi:MAG TPA: MarR family transcriptional regulator [Polyangiaceae bacterium]|jgi:DNA-binding MarR family transcriptional regulator|nr:MarR family transcriptional regulator [Polyangiaceae bacterium]
MSRKKKAQIEGLWRRFVVLIVDTKDDWRHKMSAATGLPFGRVRALRRLLNGPKTLRELAEMIGSDAPATTVLVNDLEARGLIVRAPHPTNRRAKLVSLTPSGHELALRAGRVMASPPSAFEDIAAEDLAALGRVIETLHAAHARDSLFKP